MTQLVVITLEEIYTEHFSISEETVVIVPLKGYSRKMIDWGHCEGDEQCIEHTYMLCTEIPLLIEELKSNAIKCVTLSLVEHPITFSIVSRSLSVVLSKKWFTLPVSTVSKVKEYPIPSSCESPKNILLEFAVPDKNIG